MITIQSGWAFPLAVISAPISEVKGHRPKMEAVKSTAIVRQNRYVVSGARSVHVVINVYRLSRSPWNPHDILPLMLWNLMKGSMHGGEVIQMNTWGFFNPDISMLLSNHMRTRLALPSMESHNLYQSWWFVSIIARHGRVISALWWK